MAHKVSDACVGCGACEGACPVGAITDDFHGLPPVHIITAEYDPLCDEGEMLYQHLTEQGVKCTAQRWLGVIHGFFQLGGVSQSARDLMRDIAGRFKHARGE